MSVKRFRTKIVEIEAMQFTGENFYALNKWTDGLFQQSGDEDFPGHVYDELHMTWILVAPGQWIVRGAKGEFYPCDDETFHWKYEEVTAEKPGCMSQWRIANG